MRVLVTGSRRRYWPDRGAARALVAAEVAGLPQDCVVIVGDADGVDEWVRELCARRALFVAKVEVGQHHYRRYGPGAPVKRDHAMLSLLKPDEGDYVIALQCDSSPGTQRTIERALELGLEVRVQRVEGAQLELKP